MKWPLNANKADACCRCGRVLAPVADMVAAAKQPVAQLEDNELHLFQPDLGSPPQYMCGKCLKEYGT